MCAHSAHSSGIRIAVNRERCFERYSNTAGRSARELYKPESPERGSQKLYVVDLQMNANLGSWHSTAELLPLSKTRRASGLSPENLCYRTHPRDFQEHAITSLLHGEKQNFALASLL